MGLYRYIELGGVMMWPLLACSVLLVAVLLERAATLIFRGRAALAARSTKPALPPDPAAFPHTRVLDFLIDVPPSLGLLGTVIGVVRSFNLTGGPINADIVGSGLAIACMTTIFGLGIAIIASIARHTLDAITPAQAALPPQAPHQPTR